MILRHPWRRKQRGNMDLDKRILEIFSRRKVEGFSSFVCSLCSAGCCRQPGFAIFENTVKIYEKYLNGLLKRDDFVFDAGLNYKEFIKKYFDVVLYTDTKFFVFFPKIVISENQLLSTPPFGSYYQNRDYIHQNNPWIKNFGCVFQNRKRIKHGEDIKCILHDINTEKEVSAKPIDCLYLSCTPNQVVVNPTAEETNEWFKLLNELFPEGETKYINLIIKNRLAILGSAIVKFALKTST
jgi:hypothetical protein